MKTPMKRSERYTIKKSAKWKTAGSVLVSSLVLGGAVFVGNSSVSAEESSRQVEVQTSDTFTTDSSSQSDELVTYQAPIQYVEEAARVNPSSEVSTEEVAETTATEDGSESAASSEVAAEAAEVSEEAKVAETETTALSDSFLSSNPLSF